MSVQITTSVGKSKIAVAVAGCVNCGAEFAAGWSKGRDVRVIINGRQHYVTVPVCDACKTALETAAERGAGQ